VILVRREGRAQHPGRSHRRQPGTVAILVRREGRAQRFMSWVNSWPLISLPADRSRFC